MRCGGFSCPLRRTGGRCWCGRTAATTKAPPWGWWGWRPTFYNNTTTARSTYSEGATWDDLAGDGHTFRIPNDEAMVLEVVVLPAGIPITRQPAVPGGVSAPVAYRAQDLAGTAEIAEDGWLRPFGGQVADWDFEFRPLEPPRPITHRYTDFDQVKTILRASPTRTAGFDANFTDRLNACIASAERRIDAFCGRRFDRSAQASRTFRVNTPVAIDIDDVDLAHSVAITDPNKGQIEATDFRIWRTNVSYNVGRYVEPVRRNWSPRIGYDITVSANFGWPQVPDEVVDYAGRLAAAIFDSDAAASGLIGTSDGMAYGRTPGKDIASQLGHLRRMPVG